MNKKLVLVTMLTTLITLLFTADIAFAWFYSYRYRTASDYRRCLGIRCDRTERIVFRTPRLETPTYRYTWSYTWRRRPTTCYQFVWE